MGWPAAFAAQEETEGWNPNQPFFSPGKKAKVPPLFLSSLPTPKEAAICGQIPRTAQPIKKTQPRTYVDDVVLDDYAEGLWKLRALHAVKSFSGTRIVALGGPSGKYAADAPQKCQERFGMKIVDVSYDDF